MESVAIQMKNILDEYSEEVQTATNNAIKTVSRDSALKLQSSSPKNNGDYASGWAVKRQTTRGHILGAVVYNRKHPGLTHLLENGHVSANQYGTYGRVAARPHIKQVEQWAINELQEEIERQLP